MPVTRYVNVVLPVPITGTFTYLIPDNIDHEVTIGSRVIVPFGKRKYYTGVVVEFVPQAPGEYTVKEVMHVLDPTPIVRHPQLMFWQWMADYYLCTLGEVYKAALPTGLKIESETLFECNPDFEPADIANLTEREVIAYQLLESNGKLSAKEIERQTGFRNVPSMMQRMFDKGATVISESLVSRYRAKRKQYVRIAFDRDDEAALREAFASVKGAPKQENMLVTLLHLSQFTDKSKPMAEVPYEVLIDKSKSTSAILKALCDKHIAERYTVEVSRFRPSGVRPSSLPALSEAQNAALLNIHAVMREKNIVLLHGVTSSGKTEIYMHLIRQALNDRSQVLYLVPEIALTTQLTARLQAVFGDRLIIYHSKFTDNERVEIWNKLLRSVEPYLVIGARSAVFLPFAKLGLVIVDEEHEPSYKQYEPAPRYNGRDSAIMLAHMHGAKTLLGSATPSVESYYKAVSGKYGLVTLSERYNGASLPEIEIVDVSKEYKSQTMRGQFSSVTVQRVNEAVEAHQQAIIFHNRRGFAPMARCKQCQYIPKCKCCDVSLTYHKRINSLVCHYCGASYPMPEVCPACKEPSVEVVGYGTERIEDEVEALFPQARIVRMDLDTTRNKNSYEKLIETFSTHRADILVGTQMVTKGLDFGDVSVVGVVNADSLINFPDFHSSERAFNMLEQVSGRAGRRDVKGRVLIQTRSPEHPVIQFVKEHDYLGFYTYEVAERQAFAYPPFARVIYIYLKHRDERELDHIASDYATHLRQLFGTRVNGPTKPPIGKIQNLYIRQIMLKVELNASMVKVKQILRDLYIRLHSTQPSMRSLILYYDVDPY